MPRSHECRVRAWLWTVIVTLICAPFATVSAVTRVEGDFGSSESTFIAERDGARWRIVTRDRHSGGRNMAFIADAGSDGMDIYQSFRQEVYGVKEAPWVHPSEIADLRLRLNRVVESMGKAPVGLSVEARTAVDDMNAFFQGRLQFPMATIKGNLASIEPGWIPRFQQHWAEIFLIWSHLFDDEFTRGASVDPVAFPDPFRKAPTGSFVELAEPREGEFLRDTSSERWFHWIGEGGHWVWKFREPLWVGDHRIWTRSELTMGWDPRRFNEPPPPDLRIRIHHVSEDGSAEIALPKLFEGDRVQDYRFPLPLSRTALSYEAADGEFLTRSEARELKEFQNRQRWTFDRAWGRLKGLKWNAETFNGLWMTGNLGRVLGAILFDLVLMTPLFCLVGVAVIWRRGVRKLQEEWDYGEDEKS